MFHYTSGLPGLWTATVEQVDPASSLYRRAAVLVDHKTVHRGPADDLILVGEQRLPAFKDPEDTGRVALMVKSHGPPGSERLFEAAKRTISTSIFPPAEKNE